MGTGWSCSAGGRILPRAGAGAYLPACSDLMIKDGPNGDSGIFLRIYYPTLPITNVVPPETDHPIWLERKEYLQGLASYLKQSSRRMQLFTDWIVGEKSNVSRSIPSSKSLYSLSAPTFPIIIFSHGLAGCRHFYSTVCSSLASYGFVVAAVEHRDYSACWTYKLIPDSLSGRSKERAITLKLLESGDKEFKIRSQQLGKRVSECVKALHVLEEIHLGQLKQQDLLIGKQFDWTQFKGRLNLSRSAVIGHSFGGATAMAATAFSPDFQASVVLDGWMFPLDADHYARAAQPTMFINAGKWQWKENLRNMKRFSDEAERIMYTFPDGSHQTFTDFPFLVNSFLGRRLGLVGNEEPQLLLEAVVETTVLFLRKLHEGDTAAEAVANLVDTKFSHLLTEGPCMDLSKQPVSNL